MWKAFITVILCLWPATVEASRTKIALLIGNQNYSSEIGRLVNPHNDVALLEEALRKVDFQVTTAREAGLSELHRAINGHVRKVRAAGPDAIGLLYYSGHGAQDAVTGINYLIPIDVASAEDGELWDRSLRLNEVTQKLKAEAGNASHFVIVDACRNALKLTKPGTRALVQSKGFVPVRDQPGMLIAYATAEGELATDVGAGSGPYARVLAEEIVKPGIEAVTMFRRVQLRVRASIGQEPWLGFGALDEIHFAGSSPTQPSASFEQQAELALWATVKDANDPDLLQSYLERFPKGSFASAARIIMEKLRRESQENAAAADRERELRAAEDARKAAENAKIESERKEALARQEDELRKARAEAARAREQLAKAEAEREAARKAAEDARRAAKLAQEEREKAVSAAQPERGTAAQKPSPRASDKCFTFQGRSFCP